MKAIPFVEGNVTFAENQPEYTPLPALIHKGVVISCWALEEGELQEVKESGRVYLAVWTNGAPLQPLMLDSKLNTLKANVDFLAQKYVQVYPEVKSPGLVLTLAQQLKAIELIKYFIARVEGGEIKSTVTYGKYKDFIDSLNL